MVLAIVIAGLAAPQGLPAFEFRGFRARDEYREADPRFSSCIPMPFGKACSTADKTMAGRPVEQIGVAYGPRGMFALEVKFAEEDSMVIETALRKKYGAPCSSKVERVKNALGKSFQRRVRVWCFKEGKATFRSMTDSRSVGRFEFATKDADSQAAVTDF